MSLLLTLQHGPRSQAVRETRLDQGELVIGRSADADWQIDDPDMFVSRAHCKVSARGDSYFVTDTSSSGLFINDAGSPLGAGNSAQLQDGMRLRLGDYVVSVEVGARATKSDWSSSTEGQPNSNPTPHYDHFFSAAIEEAPRQQRPAGLPDPFEKARPNAFNDFQRSEPDKNSSQAFDDPFSMEPVSTPGSPPVEEVEEFRSSDPDPFGFGGTEARGRGGASDKAPSDFGFGGAFGLDADRTPEEKPAAVPEPLPPFSDEPAIETHPGYAPWELPPEPETAESAPVSDWHVTEPAEEAHAPIEARPLPPAAAMPDLDAQEEPAPEIASPPPPVVRPAPVARPEQPAIPADKQRPPVRAGERVEPADGGADVVEAFLRGLGIDSRNADTNNPAAQMEQFGREYRLMLEGLMQLLRKRAEEKGNARVAQTVVGASAVNPLKFMPTADDALAIFMRNGGAGFLGGEEAIGDSVRDLAEHHVRAWRGVQAALRRMIDRFDPVALEKELQSTSTLGNLLGGGKNAKLWELYRKRHRDIAQSAENRFLGEIGADFRDAYEEE